jgi:hypothetical protein
MHHIIATITHTDSTTDTSPTTMHEEGKKIDQVARLRKEQESFNTYSKDEE